MFNTSEKILDYLALRIKNFVQSKKGGKLEFLCPNIARHKFPSRNPTATFLPDSDKIICPICGWKGTPFDVVRLIDEEKKNKSDAEITEYLIELFNLDEYKELNAYLNYNFALIPLLKNSKVPFEKNWTSIEHKDKTTWIKWLNNGLNVGIRTGEVSGITVVDVDLKIAPTEEVNEVYKLLLACETLVQDTPHGKHFVFKYDKDIAQTTNIGGLHIDIRNDGGQIVTFPSQIGHLSYKWQNLGTTIKSVSEIVKTKLLELNKVDRSRTDSMSKEMTEADVQIVKEGEGRNTILTSIGGALINKFDVEDTAYILSLISKNFMKPELPFHEIKAMLGSLTGYKVSADEGQEKAIYEYIKLIQNDVSAKDIMDSLRLPRNIVDKYLSKFVKDGKAVRLGRGRYQYKEKIEWSDATPQIIQEYTYKMPFFNNVAIFQDADCLILGGKTNEGKTTIALNMLKEVIAQGLKPYYIYNEAGSRFQKTSQMLGIEGKFYHCQHSNPLAVELESNSFTIIDWLCLENKAETDTVLKHLNDELQRKRGILVIFTQLKKDYEYFAPNLIDHFPTFAARYIQDNDSHSEGHFQCDKIKEPRANYTTFILPCEYNHQTRVFKPKELV
jgi:hypothetical protein